MDLQKTIPYYAIGPFDAGFQQLEAHGFLQSDANDYVLSEKGRQALTSVFEAAQNKLGEIEKMLSPSSLEALQALLQRLNNAAANSQEIAEKLCFYMQIQRVPSKSHSILSDIEDMIGVLYAFRCDGHRQAWQKNDYELDGPTWETLSTLWQGDANSVATITENRLNARPTRGFGEAIYAKSVETVVGYGWVEVDDLENQTYRLTENGRTIRQAAEDETDRLFYGIWSVLSDAESEDLNGLTLQLVEQLSQPIIA
jgi:DNA-binding MarR family transcriptional regulator